jgi:hypothetical protein
MRFRNCLLDLPRRKKEKPFNDDPPPARKGNSTPGNEKNPEWTIPDPKKSGGNALRINDPT